MTTSAPPRDDLDQPSYLDRALNAIPGRAHVLDGLADIDSRLRALGEQDNPAAVPHALAADAADAVIATGPTDAAGVLDTLGRRTMDERTAAETRNAQRGQLIDVRRRLADHLTRLDRDGLDHALAWLADALTDLVERARSALDALDGIDTADQAIDADLGQQWRHAGRLAADVDALRSAQGDLIETHTRTAPDARVRLWGSLEYPERLAAPDELMALEARARDRDQPTLPTPPWVGDTVPALRALIDGGAEPCVATPAQMHATAERVRRLATGRPPAPHKASVVVDEPSWGPVERHAGAQTPTGTERGRLLGASRQGGALANWTTPDRGEPDGEGD